MLTGYQMIQLLFFGVIALILGVALIYIAIRNSRRRIDRIEQRVNEILDALRKISN